MEPEIQAEGVAALPQVPETSSLRMILTMRTLCTATAMERRRFRVLLLLAFHCQSVKEAGWARRCLLF